MKKIYAIIFTLMVAGLTSFSYPNKTHAAITECYKVQGDHCISDGLRDSCDNSLGRYDSSAECEQSITQNGTGQFGRGGGTDIRAGQEVTKETLDALNPLILEGDPDIAEELSTPGGIISRLLGSYAFPIAGLILFVMLIWGGIEMMAGAATSKSVDAGKQRITSALLGFLLLFSAFWIARILEMVFGIKIL